MGNNLKNGEYYWTKWTVEFHAKRFWNEKNVPVIRQYASEFPGWYEFGDEVICSTGDIEIIAGPITLEDVV